jgi:Dihaem cytochrome c
MHSKLTISISVICITLISCATALYVPTNNDAIKNNVPLETLVQGRDLYVNKCGSCHNLHLPSQYTNQQWHPILIKMQIKAKLSDSQMKLISRYIETNTKE